MLEVPLDYENEAAGTTGIAFMKWTTNSTNSSSAQDILINPGGPGASGVQLLRQNVPLFQEVFGTDNNIVGFDPRAVNNSGPSVSCFPGQHNTAALYDPDFRKPVDANDTKSMVETWARAGAFGEWCTHVHSGANSSAKYVNTPATATDMLRYTEVLAKSKGEDPSKSQLWYYGASYGTVLGSTFAALFPDRVGRMILDGVVDGEDYYQAKWEANLPDADAIIRSFFTFCYDAGKDLCPFWSDSASAIEARFDAIVENIKAHPMIVTNASHVDYPVIVTYTDFKQVLLGVPYIPLYYFPMMAEALVALEQGDASLVAEAARVGTRNDRCNTDVELGDVEPQLFIACNDGAGRFNLSDYDAWEDHVALLVAQSQYLGEGWAPGVSVNCRSLDIRPPESQLFTGPPSADNTSTPILFASNTLDPVTPHRAAEKMSKLFGGSGLITQDAVGHCTVDSPSQCVFEYMRQYIKDGSLPPEGTVCQPDEVPFQSDMFGGSSKAKRAKRALGKRHIWEIERWIS